MSQTGRIQQVAEARKEAMGDTPARKRIGKLLDEGSFVELDGFVKAGVVCGYGSVMGSPAAIFAQDSSQLDGAVGAAHAAKIIKVYELALKTGVPVIGLYDSHGASLKEGVGALAAYGDILRHINNLSGVVPQISLVLGTCAGVSSMLACSADFLVMSKDARLYMAAPGKDELAGTAQAAAKAGVAQIVGDEGSAIESVRRLVSMLPINNLSAAPVVEFTEAAGGSDVLQAACEKPVEGSALVAATADENSALELLPEFGKTAYTAIGTMGGAPCGFVATNGEQLCREGCAKIAKLVSICDAFQLPVVTFVSAEGMASSAASELCGSIRDMARMAHIYAEATTAKIAVVTGPAYGAAFVALAGRGAGSDYTIAWPSAVISPLDPKTAVAFLHSDEITSKKPRADVEAEYIAKEASPYAAAAGGHIDDVIDPAVTRPALLSALDLLSAKRMTTLPKKHSNLPL